MEIIVGEYRDTNDKNYQFYVGAINNTQTNYYVTIEMDVHKEGEQNKSIRKSSSVNPGQQKVLWDTRDKVKDFKVKDVRLTKL